MPFAGHKGYGIALMIETLAGLLSGGGRALGDQELDRRRSLAGRRCTGRRSWRSTSGKSCRSTTFSDRVDAMIRDIRETPKAKGAERIYLPGEMEWRHQPRGPGQGNCAAGRRGRQPARPGAGPRYKRGVADKRGSKVKSKLSKRSQAGDWLIFRPFVLSPQHRPDGRKMCLSP